MGNPSAAGGIFAQRASNVESFSLTEWPVNSWPQTIALWCTAAVLFHIKTECKIITGMTDAFFNQDYAKNISTFFLFCFRTLISLVVCLSIRRLAQCVLYSGDLLNIWRNTWHWYKNIPVSKSAKPTDIFSIIKVRDKSTSHVRRLYRV